MLDVDAVFVSLVPSKWTTFDFCGTMFVATTLRGPKSKTMQPIILLSKLAKKKQHNTNTGNNETRNKQCKRTCSRSAKGKKKVYRGLLAVFFGSFVFFASSDGEQPQRMHKTERTGWTISVDVNLHINQPGHLRTPINKITFSYYWFTNFDCHRRREQPPLCTVCGKTIQST